MPAAINRIGEKHGKLTVTEKSDKGPRSYWVCLCDCGGSAVVSNSNLKSGNSSSCGCDWKSAIKGNMIGRRFGALVVTKEADGVSYGASQFAKYECSCDCGGSISTLGMSLRNGDTKSCGCAYKVAGAIRRKPVQHKKAVAQAACSKRRAAKKLACVAFDKEFFDLVRVEAHALAKLRTAMTGVEHDVDHIVPLTSEIVCGLHNEFNLAVIPAATNRSKGNRQWPDMP